MSITTNVLPSDLHVLGLPPAFTLSQDQTLHLKLCAQRQKTINAYAKMCQQHTTVSMLIRYTAKQINVCKMGKQNHPTGVHTNYLRIFSKN